MVEVGIAHTAELSGDDRSAARALLEEVFDDLTDSDWEHTLGGVHALVWEGAELVGHASVIQRRLLHGDRALRAGYIEGVAVRADRRRRGLGAAMMTALEPVVRGAYDLGALSATDEGAAFYLARGWRYWHGPTAVLTPTGIRRTEEDDGGIYPPVQEPRRALAKLARGRRDLSPAGESDGGRPTMRLAFRNIDITPEDPVAVWPTEAILTALERGGLGHWRRLAAAIEKDPWGPVARRV